MGCQISQISEKHDIVKDKKAIVNIACDLPKKENRKESVDKKKNEENLRSQSTSCESKNSSGKTETTLDNVTISSVNENRSCIDQSVFVQQFKAQLKERYVGLRKLGSGAYGEVIECRCINSEERRAVKIIKKNKVKDSTNSAILYELSVVKQLDHPNIMKVYEFFEDEYCFYIVMEVYSGGELFDAIIERQRFTESDAGRIMKQILSGITYLHKNGIVHRDLKPENLLLETKEEDSTIKIVDFGLSAFINPAIKMKERLGTVYYIAPEVLKQKYDEKCDVWSAGVILYILLCGYPPFSGSRDEDILAKIDKGKYTYDNKYWSSISNEAKDLIDKMLTYNSEKRITAEEAYNHQWILNATKAENKKIQKESLVTAMRHMKKFQASQKLARAALLFMGSKLTTLEERKELTNIFSSLDENGDGRLDRQELIHGFHKLRKNKENTISLQQVEKEVDKILEFGDFDHNGFIDYSEFITVAMDKNILLSTERLKAAFNMFDSDKSGKIAAVELVKIFSDMDVKQLNEIIEQVDLNHDSEVDFNEFVALMKKIL